MGLPREVVEIPNRVRPVRARTPLGEDAIGPPSPGKSKRKRRKSKPHHNPGSETPMDAVEDSDEPGYIRLRECEVMRLTDKAVLLRFDDETFWVPKSQMLDDEVSVGEIVDLDVREWFARQEGMI